MSESSQARHQATDKADKIRYAIESFLHDPGYYADHLDGINNISLILETVKLQLEDWIKLIHAPEAHDNFMKSYLAACEARHRRKDSE